MRSLVALVLLFALALQLVPSGDAEQVAVVRAIAPGHTYDISFALQAHVVTIRSCDLVSRAGSTTTRTFTTTATSNVDVANPVNGGRTLVALHMEFNSTALTFSGDFTNVNGQLTAIDGSGTDRATSQTFNAAALPASLVPSGLVVC